MSAGNFEAPLATISHEIAERLDPAAYQQGQVEQAMQGKGAHPGSLKEIIDQKIGDVQTALSGLRVAMENLSSDSQRATGDVETSIIALSKMADPSGRCKAAIGHLTSSVEKTNDNHTAFRQLDDVLGDQSAALQGIADALEESLGRFPPIATGAGEAAGSIGQAIDALLGVKHDVEK